MTTVQAELQQSTENLKSIKAFGLALQEDNTDEAFNQFNELWRRSVDALNDLQDEPAWENLTRSDFVNHRVRLPFTNSVPAKALRCTVVLASISQLLVPEIFRVVHFIDEDTELRQELYFLAQDNPGKEAFLRALLISLNDQQERDLHIKFATQQTYKQVKELLEPDIAERFRANVESIFRDAAHLWRRLQANKRHYDADLEIPDDQSLVWKAIQLSNTELKIDEQDATMKAFSPDEVELRVFPRVYVVGQREDVPVFPGRVLQQSQTTAARQEIEQAQSSTPSTGNTTAKVERRRMSLYMKSQSQEQNGGAFLGSNAVRAKS
ncbi:hypothetical protein H2198_008017 [Neophaeococcomyces mojaviensis]|uniref:Uncharacterized protein n=1 Tax=Neophaeococcomyces mojaviensis TaxID=3383035 RepID=A0ACC2ZYI3_9EURO|nr:hypothetical protein H2198_008017 [Knufia sp. JES_112]